MYYVYFLKSKSFPNKNYIGYTTNLNLRFIRHNSGKVRSTKPYRPWEIIFYECYKSKKDAKRREKYLKTNQGKRALKIMLRDS